MTEVMAKKLPENIVLTIKKVEEKRASYTAQRDRLANLGKRLEKHKKTAEAAEQQSKQAGVAWREKFRIADGEITKEVRELKREEADSRDFAQEYRALTNELSPEFELCQIEAHFERNALLNQLNNGCLEYSTYALAQAAEELFYTPEGKAFLTALKQYRAVEHYYRTAEGHTPITPTADMIEASINKAIEKHQIDINNEVWSTLTLESRSDYEAPASTFSSFIQTQRRIKELKQQLGRNA